MTELLRFSGMNNSDYIVIDIPDRDLFELECDEIMFIDNDLKQSIIEELTEQLDIDRLRQFVDLCKEVA